MKRKIILRSWFQRHPWALLEKHPWSVVTAVLAGVLALGSALRSFATLRDQIDRLVVWGLNIDWVGQSVTTKFFFFLLLLGLPVLVLIFLLLHIRSIITQPLEVEQARKTSRILSGMMRASNRIGAQLLPEGHKKIKSLVKVKCSYLIYKDFTCEVRREYEIKATGGLLHFWEIVSGVEPEADKVDYPEDINFEVQDESGDGHGVRYLVTKNIPTEQVVLAFFLPRIDPAETKPRKIVVTYTWPGMFKKLKQTLHERYEWNLESQQQIKSAEFFFYLEGGTGYNLEIETPAGSPDGTQVVSDVKHPDKKWVGKFYQILEAPEGKYAVDLRLQKP
jgi:hypothetical protein